MDADMSNKDSINKNEENGNNVKKSYINEKIRELRENLGLRRTEFGAKIGYTYQQVVRVEEGLTPVSEELAGRICREYRVTEAWLSGEEKNGQDFLEEDGGEQRRKRLRRAYEDSGLSQREFAKRTQASTMLLKDVLAGRRQMTIHYAKKIEDAFGVGSDWLLYGDEDAKEYPYGDAMIRYLKKHPDVRREIWEKMADDGGEKSESQSESNDMKESSIR